MKLYYAINPPKIYELFQHSVESRKGMSVLYLSTHPNGLAHFPSFDGGTAFFRAPCLCGLCPPCYVTAPETSEGFMVLYLTFFREAPWRPSMLFVEYFT